jgi:hypothetical protein
MVLRRRGPANRCHTIAIGGPPTAGAVPGHRTRHESAGLEPTQAGHHPDHDHQHHQQGKGFRRQHLDLRGAADRARHPADERPAGLAVRHRAHAAHQERGNGDHAKV